MRGVKYIAPFGFMASVAHVGLLETPGSNTN